ncbi:ABC transporter permease [Youngiibacter fragilis]|uniref:ABC-2 type transporter transmembrane domain-containing protein n=1 Tax=Youngiibacter fragilis 232.1 TaxID=994573 RepID=V7I7N6_9CLOT|nr:ABC transporter permease [Youngiibacter fragilis]ETA81032.1 hypothetical protein T472_0208705 [Youngiibacter fragilis 232.1]
MQVFKLCLKIIRKNLPLMGLYIGIFLFISILISSSNTQRDEKITAFTASKTAVAFMAEEDTPLVRGLKDELAKVGNFIEIDDTEDAIKDALFFRSVYYVIRIPEGFTDGFMSGKPSVLETTIVPGTIAAVYLDMAVDQYLNTARLYADTLPGITGEEMASKVKEDLSGTADVEISIPEGSTNGENWSIYYFNYMAYSLLSVLILGISSIMLVLKDKDIMKRNFSSPLKRDSITSQMFLATVLFTVAAWLILAAACFILNFKRNLNINFLMFLLNSFIFALASTGISFLIASLIKGRNAIAAVSNVVTMGSCFLGGVFVPQEFLGPAVLQVARLMPTYWYVRANTAIGSISRFDLRNSSDILISMAIVAAFGIAAFIASILLGRRKSLTA